MYATAIFEEKYMWQQAGFIQTTPHINQAMDNLNTLLTDVKNLLESFSESVLMVQPAAGKWSSKQLLGHLIDSALHNLRRFTEIQFLPQPYCITAYQQNDLVIVNNYQHLPVSHLLNLWAALNQQIIYVVKNIPEEKLHYPVQPQYDNNEVKSLGWIIGDYVAHIEHHYRQMLPAKN